MGIIPHTHAYLLVKGVSEQHWRCAELVSAVDLPLVVHRGEGNLVGAKPVVVRPVGDHVVVVGVVQTHLLDNPEEKHSIVV